MTEPSSSSCGAELPRSLDLSHQHVLVSGGAGALGAAIAATLISHGARLTVLDVLSPTDAADRLGDRLFGSIAYYQADCSDETAVATLFGSLDEANALPTTVCAHAGIVRSAPIEQFAATDFDDTMRTNTRAAFILGGEAARRWKARRVPGHLIFTSSWVQDVPWPEITPYAASKAALRTLARGYARELAGSGIRANVIAPGIVGAGMAKHQWDTDPSYRRRAERAIPLGQLQTPQSVADAFLFLTSHLADYMTGATLLVDGGAGLYPLD